MIFPIEATRRLEYILPVDLDNPEHEKYYSKGEKLYKLTEDTEGVILSYEMVTVTDDKETKTEAQVLFAHEEDGDIVLDSVPMRLMRIKSDVFNKRMEKVYGNR